MFHTISNKSVIAQKVLNFNKNCVVISSIYNFLSQINCLSIPDCHWLKCNQREWIEINLLSFLFLLLLLCKIFKQPSDCYETIKTKKSYSYNIIFLYKKFSMEEAMTKAQKVLTTFSPSINPSVSPPSIF